MLRSATDRARRRPPGSLCLIGTGLLTTNPPSNIECFLKRPSQNQEIQWESGDPGVITKQELQGPRPGFAESQSRRHRQAPFGRCRSRERLRCECFTPLPRRPLSPDSWSHSLDLLRLDSGRGATRIHLWYSAFCIDGDMIARWRDRHRTLVALPELRPLIEGVDNALH